MFYPLLCRKVGLRACVHTQYLSLLSVYVCLVFPVLQEAYSNPIAPPDGEIGEKRNLSNDDFRRLMMTPRASSGSTAAAAAAAVDAPTSSVKLSSTSSHKSKQRSHISH